MAGEDGLLPSPSSRKGSLIGLRLLYSNAWIDRLPTVSASQTLHALHARGARTVSTGIVQLDKILCAPSLPGFDATGGYMRGKVTEIFGPSGVGKTSFG